MDWSREWKPLAAIIAVFIACYYLPVEWLQQAPRVENALWESLYLVKWYAQEHVILCLIPAFFIAGAVGVFVSQASVMKYLGPKANKFLAYGVASVSGSILAVCSCTILPLFAGIYRMGAGLGPASAFLYSGPAINILAIVLTGAVLGPSMGIARAVGAVSFAIVIGVCMHFFFRREELEKSEAAAAMPEPEVSRPLWQNALYFASMVGILVFANWGQSSEPTGVWHLIYQMKWPISGALALALAVILVTWFNVNKWRMLLAGLPVLLLALVFPQYPSLAFVAGAIGLSVLTATSDDEDGELPEWFETTWDFAKKILPLLFWGVLIAGALLGRPGHEALIPSEWIAQMVGGNSLQANLFASVVGAFMYFATLTEVPILQGLIGSGMGQGPALALLLAGPALSLPNMLVIRSVIGTKKTVVFVVLVIIMATISGLIYGSLFTL
ncbi:permease [Geoalkalibacter subterraneus]|uniref:Permease n=1 Tax=Geoalkalibacter subterraneus TaxID=483547 RepID=A0A0B5FI85_9BACT|nr:permease [Geoalkalibacter subterraneus]AJF07033.1 permease [Geoalkalibacter subterraneus]